MIFGLSAALPSFAQTPPPRPATVHPSSASHASPTTLSEAKQASVVNYIRERFGVAGSVKLTFGEIKQSDASPGFFDSALTISDGTNTHQQEILVSKDGRFLVVVTGAVIDVPQDTPAEEVARIREVLKMPPALKVSLSPFKPSASFEFKQATMSLDDGKSKQDRTVLLARDGKHLVVSDLYNMGIDPRRQALQLISLRNEPSIGPANAPVTIVEYADLQCPTCKRMHEFLETKIIPRYGDKVRIVFKEFPLPMHDWSFTAAIADQCAYQINPSTYLPLRTLIFRNQELINIANLRDTLLNYGEQAGLDRVQLAGCLDSKASLARIERDKDEAKRVDVNSTPTLFINGKKMVGLPSEDAYYQAIDDALSGK
jgi:protein-disulfide isomerase